MNQFNGSPPIMISKKNQLLTERGWASPRTTTRFTAWIAARDRQILRSAGGNGYRAVISSALAAGIRPGATKAGKKLQRQGWSTGLCSSLTLLGNLIMRHRSTHSRRLEQAVSPRPTQVERWAPQTGSVVRKVQTLRFCASRAGDGSLADIVHPPEAGGTQIQLLKLGIISLIHTHRPL